MTKKVKIMFSALALTVVAGISIASVVSCTTYKPSTKLSTNQSIANAFITYLKNNADANDATTRVFRYAANSVTSQTQANTYFTDTWIQTTLQGTIKTSEGTFPTISYNGTSYTTSEWNFNSISISNTKYNFTTKILTFDVAYNGEVATIGTVTYNLVNSSTPVYPVSSTEYGNVADAFTNYFNNTASNKMTQTLLIQESNLATIQNNTSLPSDMRQSILNDAITKLIQEIIAYADPTVSANNKTYTANNYVATDITVINASYDTIKNTIAFTIQFDNTSASGQVSYNLPTTPKSPVDSKQYANVANAFTTYFNETSIQQQLITGLSKIVSTGTSDLTTQVMNGAVTILIETIIVANSPSVSYNDTTYSPDNYLVNEITAVDASYNTSMNQISFSIAFNGIKATTSLQYTLTV